MDADVVLTAVAMVAADADSTDARDATALIRVLISDAMLALMTACVDASNEVAVLVDVENDTSEPARFTNSADMALLNTVSAAARFVDAVASAFPTAATDAVRAPTSDNKLLDSATFLEAMAVVAPANAVDAVVTDALNTLTSALNAVLKLTSADESDTTAALSAAAMDATALTRFNTSVESAPEVPVTSAITLAICAKLGLVLNSAAISATVSKLAGALPFRLDMAALNALVAVKTSAESEDDSPDAVMESNGSAALNAAAETDAT
jgi:hypothetical protein